jgi:hypothetical protein
VHWLVTHVPLTSHVPPVHALPAALLENPHTPLTQVAVWHEPAAGCGHVAALVQPPPPPVGVHVPLKHAPFTQIRPEQQSVLIAQRELAGAHVEQVPVKHEPSRQT